MKSETNNLPLYTIGIDIGGSSTQLALVSEKGEVVARGSVERKKAHYDANLYVEELCSSIDQLLAGSDFSKTLLGIGIGAPNGNYYKGTIDSSVNLPWKEELPLTRILQERYQLPVVITNDANATAIGEMMYGAAQGMKEFYLITLGTGIGSGIVSNGKLLYGFDGKAGELGHLVIYPEGRQCGCGRRGCFESYCSARGVVATAIDLLNKHKEVASSLRDIPKESLTSKEIYNVALKGDSIAQETFRVTGEILGATLANLATFSSPEAIILFGGVTKAWHFLEAPMRKSFDAHCLFAIHRPKVLRSSLPDADAALLGAAALPLSNRKIVKHEL